METHCSTIAALLLTSCVFVASDRMSKPGECPTVFNTLLPARKCDHDRDCPRMEKCCGYSYNSFCAPPITPIPRCPMRPGVMGICLYQCSNNWDCQRGYICCFNGCGHVCMPPGKPGFCGFIRDCNGHSCFYDGQCPRNLKCCRSRCGSSCVEPFYLPY